MDTIVDLNHAGAETATKIEYNPCVICLQNINDAVDFNTACESETGESSNYFTNNGTTTTTTTTNDESLLKVLAIDIDRPAPHVVSNYRSKNSFLSLHESTNDVMVTQKFRNPNRNEESREVFPITEKEQEEHGRMLNKQQHFYCDSCFLRNKEILRIYTEIESLHKTFHCLKDSIEGAFKGGCIDDGVTVFQPHLNDSSDDGHGVSWRTLRHHFAKSFKLVKPEENDTENRELFHYYENPYIPSPSPTSPNSDFDGASSIISCQDFYSDSIPGPSGIKQGKIGNNFKLTSTSTTRPSHSVPPPKKKDSTSTSKSKSSNSKLKDVIISAQKLTHHFRPNMPIGISGSQTYLDVHTKRPLKKKLGPELPKSDSSRFLLPTRNSNGNPAAFKSSNDDQVFSVSEYVDLVLSDSDETEQFENETAKPNLPYHLGFRTTESLYKCPDCPKTLKSRAGLRVHRRSAHTGEPPYQCHICMKTFVRAIKLKNHIQIVHTDDRPYICELCGKDFPIVGHLYNHMRNIHAKPKSRRAPGAATASAASAAASAADPETPDQSKCGAATGRIIPLCAKAVSLPEVLFCLAFFLFFAVGFFYFHSLHS